MIKLTPEQYKLLCLPEPSQFLPKLAKEVRSEYPRQTAALDDKALLAEVERSYNHASDGLGITHLPTLVRWVKVDVVSQESLSQDTGLDFRIRQAGNKNLAAADVLGALAAHGRLGR